MCFCLFNEAARVLLYCLLLSSVVFYGHEFDLQIPLETMWTDIDYAEGVRVRVREGEGRGEGDGGGWGWGWEWEVRVRVGMRVREGVMVGDEGEGGG